MHLSCSQSGLWPAPGLDDGNLTRFSAALDRFGWQHVTERLITMITGEEAIASVGVISTLFAAKRVRRSLHILLNLMNMPP